MRKRKTKTDFVDAFDKEVERFFNSVIHLFDLLPIDVVVEFKDLFAAGLSCFREILKRCDCI